MRSAISSISPSLWVMKMIVVLARLTQAAHDLEELLDLLGGEDRGGLVEDDHLGLRKSTLMISTRCWMPTGRSSMTASGSTSSP
jgi:hypothetical protein